MRRFDDRAGSFASAESLVIPAWPLHVEAAANEQSNTNDLATIQIANKSP
jgi:hypothetical protein